MISEQLLQSFEDYLKADRHLLDQEGLSMQRRSLLQQIDEARRQVAEEAATGIGEIRHIMVAVDDSEQAKFALAFAVRLAARLGACLQLIHVVQTPTVSEQIGGGMSHHPGCDESWELLDRLERQIGQIEPVEKVMRFGDPATEIADSATRLGSDLIVIGTHARGRYSAAIVGSVAQGVMRKAICPVICVAHNLCELNTPAPHADTSVADYFPAAGV